MIDWNKPLIRKDTGCQVWFCGFERDDIVVVQDRAGLVARFQRDGTPVGHFVRIANDESHLFTVRTNIARHLLARANQLNQLEADAMEDSHMWGMF